MKNNSTVYFFILDLNHENTPKSKPPVDGVAKITASKKKYQIEESDTEASETEISKKAPQKMSAAQQ